MKILKVKSILFSLLTMLAVSVFMTSCEQSTLGVPDEQGIEPNSIDNALFILNNSETQVKMKEVKSSDETHFLYNYEGQNYAFDNDASFLSWANELENRSIFIEKYNYYKAQQEMAIKTGMIDDEEATERYMNEVLANSNSVNDRILYSFLFDNQSYSKFLLAVYIAHPSMGNLKNRAESMLYPVNVGALCDRTWFRGDKFWYWGIPFGGIPSFGTMNNRAESIF